jgi:TonB family protein
VTTTLQLEEPVRVSTADDAPRLLVEWTPRWDDFVTSIPPAFARSESRLAGESPFGLVPLRIMVPSYLVEAFLILAAVILPAKINQLRPYVAPTLPSHDVIYYSGDELPRTEDLGGAEAGKTGAAGGNEAHHRTQTIKIARGGSLVPRVVDAPNLKLPMSNDAVANLLAIKPNAGPPPSEGMRSTRSAPNLSASIVAPAPDVIRDYTRNGIQLEKVIAPAPNVSRDPFTTAPSLSAKVIPPAPNVSSDHPLVAPVLAPAVIPPSPKVSADRRSTAPSLTANVVAPAPTIPQQNASHDQSRSAPALASNVIPPAPGSVSQISSSPLEMADAAVVPPPVSAPERVTTRNPKLTVPAPSVIAPPPSSNVTEEMRRLSSGNPADSPKAVVPPPPAQPSSGFLSSLVGRIFGASEVVPPPPSANSTNNQASRNAPALASNVVPPPPSASESAASNNPRSARNGTSLATNVVAPPPNVNSTGVSNGTGNRSMYSSTAPHLGAPNVVPPPPSLTAAGGGTGNTAGGKGSPNGTLLANNVVPPPPSVSGGSALTGSGTGRTGAGFGRPLDVGAPQAPPVNGGSGSNAGAVISSQPGSKVGLPARDTGALALSPAGGDKPGLGGAEGGTSIGRGKGPGSGMNGEGPGAGGLNTRKTGSEHGSDPNARAGISPTPGPGGAGNANAGNPPVPGVSVTGGSSVVTLPSFGSDSSGNDPSAPGRSSSTNHGSELGVTIVASANSGGAFVPYKNLLRGETYTTYLTTSAGPVSMEFADEATASHTFGNALTAPAPIRNDLPAGLPHARMMIKCTLDASGNLRNLRVLEPGPAEMTAKVIAAMRGWKFQPATRNNQPVEVTAILGFNIDTNDRF